MTTKQKREARRDHPRLKISVDGEIGAKTPVTISVARSAIEVAAPFDGQFQVEAQ